MLFTDSTTIGVRYQEMLRERLDERVRTVDTPVGSHQVQGRDARRPRAQRVAPEFEDVREGGGARGLAIKDVQALALKAWLDAQSGS